MLKKQAVNAGIRRLPVDTIADGVQ